MQTFDSGGVLLVRPRSHWQHVLAAIMLAATLAPLPPLFGIYLLIVA